MAKISFYFDEMMRRKAAEELIKRGIEVVMAVDVGMTEKDDLTEHLPYATEHEMVLVTFDRKFAGLGSVDI
jgi:predicted nuclease of predicted toxin-antitoxin system